MNLRHHLLASAALTLLVSSTAYAQTNPFAYRVYAAGLQAAAAPAEEPAAPAAPPDLPDPYLAQVRSLMHMDAFAGSGPLDQKGLTWNAQNVSIVADAKYGAGGLAFTQANSWVDGPAIAIGGNFTVEAWVKPSSTTGVQPIVARWSDVSGQKNFLLSVVNGVPRFQFTSMLTMSGGSAPAGTWTHIAAVAHSDSYFLYVNGVQVANTYASDLFNNSTVRTTLGNTYNSSGTIGGAGMTTFKGVIDDVRITTDSRYMAANGYQGVASFPVPDRAFTNP